MLKPDVLRGAVVIAACGLAMVSHPAGAQSRALSTRDSVAITKAAMRWTSETYGARGPLRSLIESESSDAFSGLSRSIAIAAVSGSTTAFREVVAADRCRARATQGCPAHFAGLEMTLRLHRAYSNADTVVAGVIARWPTPRGHVESRTTVLTLARARDGGWSIAQVGLTSRH